MRAELDVKAAGLMAANPGWVVVTDDRFSMLLALPAHLRRAFWIYDADPNRLALRMNKVENFLRAEDKNAPAGRTMRHPQHGRRRNSRRESPQSRPAGGSASTERNVV